jgi:hypothetical protein
MKKLLLTMLLLFTVTLASAQSQFTRNYTKICVIRKDKTPQWDYAENKIIFNYQNSTTFKIVMNDGSVRFFDQQTDLSEGETQGGIKYQSATFREQGATLTVYLQIFDDNSYGTRIIFDNGDMIQFTN